jgi:diguanylate cyclase (GGDEF)-like protein/PAS domain S-box-containing protein
MERQKVSRLRTSGAIGIGAIVSVLAIQAAILILIVLTNPSPLRSDNLSALRCAYTFQMLSAATAGRSSDLHAAVGALERDQANFNDLAPAEKMLYQRFLAAPDPADASALCRVFEAKTESVEASSRVLHGRFRIAVLVATFVAFALVVLLYFKRVRPVEKQWDMMMERLTERHERFAAVFLDSADAMAIYRTNGTIVLGNAAAQRMLGLGPEGVGEHWSIHIIEAQRATARAAFERALHGVSSEFETIFVSASGTQIPVLCSLSPITVRGRVDSIVGIAKDLTDIRASEAELERSRERFRSMFDYHPDAIAVIDGKGRIVRANVELERLTHYRAQELIGMQLEALAPAQDAIEGSGLAQPLFFDKPIRFDAVARTKQGTSVMIRVDTVPMRVGSDLEGVYVIARDVTHERELEFRERVQRERLRSIAQLASAYAASVERQIAEILQFASKSLELEGAVVTRVRDDVVTIMHSTGQGLAVGTTIPFARSFSRHIFGTTNVLAFADAQRDGWAHDLAQSNFGWGSLITTTAYADGVPIGAVSFVSKGPRGRPFEESDEDFVRIVAATIGASLARELREEELAAIAYVDPVTRLPNRRYFIEQLNKAISRAERSDESIVIFYIDLDGFKSVNDQYGHASGDALLGITAARLRAVLRDGDVLARVGGDEFVAMQVSPEGDDTAVRLGARLIEAASVEAWIGEQGVSIGASVGIVAYPRDAHTAEELLDLADRAMYASKRAGKGVATMFDPEGEEAQPVRQISS